MKKAMALVLAVLLAVASLAGCTAETVQAAELKFAAGKALEVKLLSFSDGTALIEDAGTVEEKENGLLLKGPVLGDGGEETESGVMYALPEAFSTLRKRESVEGVLLFDGAVYGVTVTDAGEQQIVTLDEQLKAQSWTAFYNAALRQKT